MLNNDAVSFEQPGPGKVMIGLHVFANILIYCTSLIIRQVLFSSRTMQKILFLLMSFKMDSGYLWIVL